MSGILFLGLGLIVSKTSASPGSFSDPGYLRALKAGAKTKAPYLALEWQSPPLHEMCVAGSLGT